MYEAGGDGRIYPVSPAAPLPPREALAGVRTRRMLARLPRFRRWLRCCRRRCGSRCWC